MLTGTIRLTKRILLNEVAGRDDYLAKWIYLLCSANDTERTVFLGGQGFHLKRGQLIRSMRGLEQEWHKSEDWITRFKNFLKDQGMCRFQETKKGTIITILNYDVYNPVSAHEPGTDPDTEPGTEQDTKPGTEQGRNREEGIGNRKVEGAAAVEIPSEQQVLEFGASWPGDQARGIPPAIPRLWLRDWYNWRCDEGKFPADWQDSLVRRFTTAWERRDPRVLGCANGKNTGGKNGQMPGTPGQTPAQRIFELDRKLKELEVQAACFEDTQPELAVKLEKQAAELRRERKALE